MSVVSTKLHGVCGTLMNLLEDPRFNHQPQVTSGLLAEECGALLSAFFKQVRQGEAKRPGNEQNQRNES